MMQRASQRGLRPPWEVSLAQLPGVGPQRMEALSRLNLHTVWDLLCHFPFRYQSRKVISLQAAEEGQVVTFEGIISATPYSRRYGRSRTRHVGGLRVEGQQVQVVWFNRDYLAQKWRPGAVVRVSGKWDRARFQLLLEEAVFVGQDNRLPLREVVPVYHVVSGITSKWLEKLVEQALPYAEEITDPLPRELLQRYRLMPLSQAMHSIHFPSDEEELKQARRRLAYEELFLYQLGLHMHRRTYRQHSRRPPREVPLDEVEGFLGSLPFVPTADQRRAIRDILEDMQQPYAMNRLLIGDVGSGKTVVAAAALFACAKAGYQGVLMVPTEIVAEQHYHTLSRWYEKWGLQIGLLTGSTPARERRELMAMAAMGLLDILVGTHTLIQEDLNFARLGLTVTDEQHRFGVKQREALRKKGWWPDALFMTATPIPRTLALTLYGDMELSRIQQLPAGRKPVTTRWVRPSFLGQVISHIQREIDSGRQAYVVCPLIEESEKLDLQNAADISIQLSQQLRGKVALLHGKMRPAEKEEIMRQFYRGEVNVLVSTSVVEVGVDVPNATIMVVMDAERFGLAQLHQLRGRVGRGEHASYCYLVSEGKSALSRARMDVIQKVQNGFEVAEQDLRLRGPGDVMGVRQSGEIPFRLSDLIHDQVMMEYARRDAKKWAEKEDSWWQGEGRPLWEALVRNGYLGKMLD